MQSFEEKTVLVKKHNLASFEPFRSRKNTDNFNANFPKNGKKPIKTLERVKTSSWTHQRFLI